jgi:hypothetical protein
VALLVQQEDMVHPHLLLDNQLLLEQTQERLLWKKVVVVAGTLEVLPACTYTYFGDKLMLY